MKYAIIPPIVRNGVKEFDIKIEELMNRPEPESYFREVPKSINELEEIIVKPRKGDIEVSSLSLTWVPHWQLTYKDHEGNTNTEIVTAY